MANMGEVMTQDLKEKIIKQSGKITVTLPSQELIGDFLELEAGKSVTVDYRQFKARIKELTERESKLVEALKWYASIEKDGIPINDNEDINDELDIGRTARQTLTELGIKQ